MVGALHRAVEREVLLDDASPQNIGHQAHGDSTVVTGISDRGVGVTITEGPDDVEVQLAEIRRITRGALHDGKRGPLTADNFCSPVNGLKRSAACRDDCRPTGLGNVPKKRGVREITTGHLVCRNVQVFEKVDARKVPWRCKELDTFGFCLLYELDVLVFAELKSFSVLTVGGTESILALVRGVVGLRRKQSLLSRFWNFTALAPARAAA